jgi:DNA processing protein
VPRVADPWAALAGPGVRPEVAWRVVRCVVGAGAQRGVIAGLLRRGEEVTVGAVLAGVERGMGRVAAARVDAVAAGLVGLGARVLVVGEQGYPQRLGWAWPELGAPAWLLWQGAAMPSGPAVAVVGTRRPTADGLRTARDLGRWLADRGVTVVSGLARGIDQAAHRGALEAGGTTTAVLGTGFGVDYPAGSAALREAVAGSGGLVSEYPPGTPPHPGQFPVRNRIVAGLADALVVVEGRTRSGALQTARLAAEMGRDVYACPGSINAPAAQGPLALIRDGATVLTALDDLLAVLPDAQPTPQPPTATTPQLRGDAAKVLATLGPLPTTAETAAAATGLPLPLTMAILTALATTGHATPTPHGYITT